MNKVSSVSIIFNARLVDAKLDSPGVIVVKNGVISGVFLCNCDNSRAALNIASAVLTEKDLQVSPEFFDARGMVLMPSFVDMHTHLRYPGQTQKEDLDSGLKAAAAGGFGTLVLMPNTNPVVSTKELALKINKEADERNLCRTFQTVSITKDFEGTDTSELDNLDSAKIPVISEDGRDVASAAVMLEAMKKAGKQGITVACHCEDVALAAAAKPYRQRGLGFMAKYKIPAGKIDADISNVPESVIYEINGNFAAANEILALAEDTATQRNIEIAKLADCHIHICHCSTKNSMDAVRRAKAEIKSGHTAPNFNCTVEVTPHHLGLAGTDEPYIRALVNPPLRSEENRRAMIEAIKDGTVDCIGTDHAPHTPEDKANGAPGFTGIETAFAVCHTELCVKEGMSLCDLSRLMSETPARILKQNTGRLLADYEANFALVDPQEIWTVNSAGFYSKGKSTPLEGQKLVGRVKATFFGGQKVFELK